MSGNNGPRDCLTCFLRDPERIAPCVRLLSIHRQRGQSRSKCLWKPLYLLVCCHQIKLELRDFSNDSMYASFHLLLAHLQPVSISSIFCRQDSAKSEILNAKEHRITRIPDLNHFLPQHCKNCKQFHLSYCTIFGNENF